MILAASDNFQDSKTTVVIHINDKNDMPPVFNSPLYATEMEEELVGAYPHHLLQVRYSILALLPQSRLRYVLSADQSTHCIDSSMYNAMIQIFVRYFYFCEYIITNNVTNKNERKNGQAMYSYKVVYIYVYAYVFVLWSYLEFAI